MKIKDEIIKLVNWNYNDYISLWNILAEKYSFPKIVSIVLDENTDWALSYCILYDDNQFINVSQKEFYLTAISVYSVKDLNYWDNIAFGYSNSSTATIRRSIPWQISYDRISDIEEQIFIWLYMFNGRIMWSYYSTTGSFSQYNLRTKFPKKHIVERNISTDRILRVIDDTITPEEEINKWLTRAMELPFVQDFLIKDNKIFFSFKPYQLDMWNSYRVNMPELNLYFDMYDKKFKLADLSYVHPHISPSTICLWSFQNVLNDTRYMFDIALINMYELACTYNKQSPFSSRIPMVWENSIEFSRLCTYEYKWITYTYDEFNEFMSTSLDNFKEILHIIYNNYFFDNNDVEKYWKSRYFKS